MPQTDPLSDFLSAIRNASTAGKEAVEIPFSNLKLAVVKALQEIGYVAKCDPVVRKGKRFIRVALKYSTGKRPVIRGLQRGSRPGRRLFVKSHAIRRVRGGFGAAILSTSRGIMTGEAARRAEVGGELLCTIW